MKLTLVSNAKIQATLSTYLSPRAFTDHTPQASSLCSAPAFGCRHEGWAPLRERGVVVGRRTKVEGKGRAWAVGKLRVAREVSPLLLFIITPPGKNKLRRFNPNNWTKMCGTCALSEPKRKLPTAVPLIASTGSNLPLSFLSLSKSPSFLSVFPSSSSASSEWIKPRDSWPVKPVHKSMFLMTPGGCFAVW